MEKFGFSEGVALGMISADANSARSRANRLSYALDDVQARNRELEQENAQLRAKLAQYEKAYGTVNDKAVVLARQASAGFIVMNGMIKALENMPRAAAEDFRRQVVAYSKERFRILDAEIIQKSKLDGYKTKTIEEVFSWDHEYKKLGFDRAK